MGVRDKAKRAAAAAVSVSLATSGLSSCNDNGAVDPLPPPFICSDFNAGQSLSTAASRDGLALEILIQSFAPARWISAEVSNVVNATLTEVELPPNGLGLLVVRLELASDSVVSGSFDLQSVVEGEPSGAPCTIVRTFQFSVGGGVTVGMSEATPLPLGARQMPTIWVRRRDGTQIELSAATAYNDPVSVQWTATDGTIERLEDDRVVWRVPERAGMYQIEVVMDYGDDGFGFDALAVEVELTD